MNPDDARPAGAGGGRRPGRRPRGQRAGTVGPTVLSGLGKTAVIYPTAFLIAVGEGMLNLGVVFFMRETYQASPSLIGLLMAFATLAYVAGCLLLRPLFDGFRPRFLLIAATGGMAVFLLLLYLFRSVPLTFLFLGLNKLFTSLFWPPVMGWLSQGIEGKALNRTMGRFNLSWSAGLVVSPALAGWLSERSASWTLIGTVLIFSATMLLLTGAALALPRLRRDGHRESGRQGAAPGVDTSTPLRFPAWMGLFSAFVMSGAIATLFPLFAEDRLAITRSLVGGLLSVRTLARAAGFVLVARWSGWHFRGRFTLLAQGVLLALLVVLPLGRTPAFFLMIFPFLGLSAAFHYSNSLFHGVSGSVRRAGRMAVHEALLNGGYITGSAAGGVLYERFSMETVFLFCLACAAAAGLLQAAFLASMRRAATRN